MTRSRSPLRSPRTALGAALACLALATGCSSDDGDTWSDGTTERTVEYSADPTPSNPTSSATPEPTGPAASLEVRPVVAEHASDDVDPSEGNVLLRDPEVGWYLELGPVALDSSHVENATVETEPNGGRWVVRVTFSSDGATLFRELTADAACRRGTPENRIALVVGGEIVSAPGVEVPCGQSLKDETVISGDFTQQEATELAGRVTGS